MLKYCCGKDNHHQMIGVYVIKRIGTDQVYVGSSTHTQKRFSEHRRDLSNKRHTSKYLQHAWDKYGPDAFSFEVIEECERTDRLYREQFYLDTLNSCYNMSKMAAGGTRKEDWTPERRAKLAAASIGKPGTRNGKKHTDEARTRMSNSWSSSGRIGMLGKKHSAAARKRISDANKVAWLTRTVAGMTGKSHSNEAKQKMRAAKLGRKQTPEQIEKRRASLAAFRASRPPEWFAEYGRKISATKRAKRDAMASA